jgi:hypothetical protein
MIVMEVALELELELGSLYYVARKSSGDGEWRITLLELGVVQQGCEEDAARSALRKSPRAAGLCESELSWV